MTYKGKKIHVPTLEMFREYIQKKHFKADPEWLYNHYKALNWKSKKGKSFKKLESLIGTGNQYFCNGRNPKRPSMPYIDQLADDRWKAFREFIFAVRGHKCEKCGATTYLQVHHPKYIPGRKAWEYTCKEVKVLCRTCHAAVHGKPVS